MANPAPLSTSHRLIVFASSLGTVFEWYDFYIFGTLAVFFSKAFFPAGDSTAAFLSSLALFGVGFSVRPFGALFFGRIGDLVGRKYTFLVTIVVMGLSTALIGLLPTYASIGFWAPVILVVLRLAQGLALGGEYGGAATYVAEHAPVGKRGAYTSWIQTTATLGLFLSLVVIGALRWFMTKEAFASWGWRLPFLFSFALLAISVFIRMKLEESPVFAQMKAEGKHSTAPLTESFCRKENLLVVLKSLFGATAGQGVVWYAGQFYALYFLTTTLGVDYISAYTMIAISLILGAALLLFFGALSDRVGRKVVILAGLALTVLTYQPIFHGITRAANPALASAIDHNPVVLSTTDYTSTSSRVVSAITEAAKKIVIPAGSASTDTAKARAYLFSRGIPFELAPATDGAPLTLRVGSESVPGYDLKRYAAALAASGYPLAADPRQINEPVVVGLLTILLAYVAMVYGPIAAFLVELFPTKIRYTSMSLPYHIGNGWFGGFLPLIAASIVVSTGDIYAGLWYPIGIAAITFVIGLLLLPETKDRDISA